MATMTQEAREAWDAFFHWLRWENAVANHGHRGTYDDWAGLSEAAKLAIESHDADAA